jgi:hypothetical protein
MQRAIEDDPFFRLPPGFQALDLDRAVQTYERRLPHWRQEGGTYFVTARQADALPPALFQQLREERAAFLQEHQLNPSAAEWKAFHQRQSQVAEGALDGGYGSCVFRDVRNRRFLQEALLRHHGVDCEFGCFALLPNHWHALLRPHRGVRLEDVLRKVKGSVAYSVNRSMGREGAVWGQESYDRLVRDARHLINVMRYIVLNGSQAGLAASEYTVWVDPVWEQAGWTADAVIQW